MNRVKTGCELTGCLILGVLVASEFKRSFSHITGEDNGCGGRATNDRCKAAFDRNGLELWIQRLGENDVGAAVISRQNDKNDGAVEVCDRPSNLSAVFELPMSERFGEPSKPDRFAKTTNGRWPPPHSPRGRFCVRLVDRVFRQRGFRVRQRPFGPVG